jgi:hypothetical protein
MIHSVSKKPVLVEETKEGLCVRLYDYGDADVLEDRLVEDCDIGTVWRQEDKKEDGSTEAFVLVFPQAKSRVSLQALVDKIQ